MNRKTRPWTVTSALALLVVAALGSAAAPQEAGRKGVAVRHANPSSTRRRSRKSSSR
jgi:hypothetical protein